MSATEIIVYRNPAEQAIWNVLGSSEMWPIFMGVVVAVVAGWLTSNFLWRITRTVRKRNRTMYDWLYQNHSYIVGVAACLYMGLTVWYMWI